MTATEKEKRIRYRLIKQIARSKLDIEKTPNLKEFRAWYAVLQVCDQYLQTWNPEATLNPTILGNLETIERNLFPDLQC